MQRRYYKFFINTKKKILIFYLLKIILEIILEIIAKVRRTYLFKKI